MKTTGAWPAAEGSVQENADDVGADKPDCSDVPEYGVGESSTGAVPQELLTVRSKDPIPLAEHYIQHCATDADDRITLRRWNEEFWRQRDDGACYRPLSQEQVSAEVYSLLDRTICESVDDEGNTRQVPIRPKSSVVKETSLALPSRGILVDGEAPQWLDGDKTHPPAKEITAAANGLLHLPTRRLYPPTPIFFGTTALSFAYDAAAPPPVKWLAFMNSIWPDDAQCQETLQELFGYVLVPDTRQQKIFLLVGPKRSGKGTIARVLTALLGQENVCSPTLASMGLNFGLQPLLEKPVAIISDARLSGRADQAAIGERLLSISGGDAVTIDRKHVSAVTKYLPTRFIVMTNELPRLADASGALASRFVVMTMTNSFYGKEDLDLSNRLMGELPSILNWAIDGWDRLTARGRFMQPESSGQAVQELEDLSSPVAAFVRDRCEIGPEHQVSVDCLFREWELWCDDAGRDYPGTKSTFGRDLRAVLPQLKVSQPRMGNERQRVYQGIAVGTGSGTG